MRIMDTNKILKAALTLPVEERAHLAQRLLSSLEGPAEPEAESAWIAEIEKRAQELADGSVTPVDWSEVRDRIRRRLQDQHS